MATSYLDKTGLTYLWGKIKDKFDTKANITTVPQLFTATCSTAASTTAKVATLDNPEGFSLTAGVRVAVQFRYGNSATTPTLRVDGSSTGTAKTIAIPTSATATSTGNGTTYNTWGAYETVIFTYSGTYWINNGSGRAIYNAYNTGGGSSSNAFGNIKVDDTTISADTASDTIEFVGEGITLTPDATNSTLTFKNGLTSVIGDSYTAKSVPSKSTLTPAASLTTVCTLEIPAGAWFLDISVYFAANSTGWRYACLSTTTTDAALGIMYQDIRPAVTVSSTGTICKFHATAIAPEGRTMYIRASQNSGSALNATPRVNLYGCRY